MKTLALRDGDLVLGPIGHKAVSGGAKTQQDLSVALREEMGVDRFHPLWGSQLQHFIGSAGTEMTQALVHAEIVRIVRNYAVVQADELGQDRLARRKPRFQADEVIREVTGVRVVQEMDRFHYLVGLRMLSGRELQLANTVDA